MAQTDVEKICQLEAQTNTYSWNKVKIQDSLDYGHNCLVCSVYLGDEEMDIAGYAAFSSVLDEASVLNICVANEYQGKGVGRLLMTTFLTSCQDEGICDVTLEVRKSNNRAIKLYQSLGFNQVGERKDYYLSDTGREDALVYGLSLECE